MSCKEQPYFNLHNSERYHIEYNTNATQYFPEPDSVKMNFPNRIKDNTGGAYNGANFTVPRAGVYEINTMYQFANTTGWDGTISLGIHLYVNGTFKRSIAAITGVTDDGTNVIADLLATGSMTMRLNKNETIHLECTHGNPNTLETNISPYRNCWVTITEVSWK